MQWLQNQNQNNVDNLNHVRRETLNISGPKRMKILELKLIKLKLRVRSNYINKKYYIMRSGMVCTPRQILFG